MARKNATRLLILALLLSFGYRGTAALDADAAPCLRLGAEQQVETFFPALRQSLGKVYSRAGLCMETVIMSANRATRMLRKGTLDGEWFRYSGYADEHSAILAVPQPMFVVDVVLMWLGDKKIDSNALDLTEYKVGYKDGFRWLKQKLPTLGAEAISMPENAPIVQLLLRGRVDMYATDSANAQLYIQSIQNTGGNVHTLVIGEIAFQHVLHTRHNDKITRLNQAMHNAIIAGDFAAVNMVPGIKAAPLISEE